MNRIKIETGFRVTVPKELRTGLKVGDEVIMTADAGGRIILLSEKRIRAALAHSAGMWQGRTDVPEDGVAYVNRLRTGRRLRRLGVTRRALD